MSTDPELEILTAMYGLPPDASGDADLADEALSESPESPLKPLWFDVQILTNLNYSTQLGHGPHEGGTLDKTALAEWLVNEVNMRWNRGDSPLEIAAFAGAFLATPGSGGHLFSSCNRRTAWFTVKYLIASAGLTIPGGSYEGYEGSRYIWWIRKGTATEQDLLRWLRHHTSSGGTNGGAKNRNPAVVTGSRSNLSIIRCDSARSSSVIEGNYGVPHSNTFPREAEHVEENPRSPPAVVPTEDPNKVRVHGILKTRWRCPHCERAARCESKKRTYWCAVHGEIAQPIDLLSQPKTQKEKEQLARFIKKAFFLGLEAWFRDNAQIMAKPSVDVAEIHRLSGADLNYLRSLLDQESEIEGKTVRQHWHSVYGFRVVDAEEPEPVDITVDIVDSHGGKLSGIVRAHDKAGNQIGYIDFGVYGGELWIKTVEVAEPYRRKGIASQMVAKLQQEFPEDEVDWGMTTEEGGMLKQVIEGGSETQPKAFERAKEIFGASTLGFGWLLPDGTWIVFGKGAREHGNVIGVFGDLDAISEPEERGKALDIAVQRFMDMGAVRVGMPSGPGDIEMGFTRPLTSAQLGAVREAVEYQLDGTLYVDYAAADGVKESASFQERPWSSFMRWYRSKVVEAVKNPCLPVLTSAKVLELWKESWDVFGPHDPKTIRDEGTLDNLELYHYPYLLSEYPDDPIRVAAEVCHYIVSNHPFWDCNHRTGWMTLLWLLEAVGYSLEHVPRDAVKEKVKGIDWLGVTAEELAGWVRTQARAFNCSTYPGDASMRRIIGSGDLATMPPRLTTSSSVINGNDGVPPSNTLPGEAGHPTLPDSAVEQIVKDHMEAKGVGPEVAEIALYAGILGMVVADAIPTPADLLYFTWDRQLRDDWEAGRIAPTDYWTRKTLIYFVPDVVWWSGVAAAVYLMPGDFWNKLYLAIGIVSGGAVAALILNFIREDMEKKRP